MNSLDSKFVEVMITRRADGKSMGRRYACTLETFKNKEQCKYDVVAGALLEEAIQKVMVSPNIIGNDELLWSWERSGKELRDKIAAK